MDLNNKRKKYVGIDRNNRSEEILGLLDEVNSAQEEDIENLMNDSDTEFIVEMRTWIMILTLMMNH